MTRELLEEMLGSRDELTAQGDAYAAPEEAGLDLLLSSQSGGPAAVRKVSQVQLGAGFVTVETEEGIWCVAYEDIAGIRLKPRGKDAPKSRTGYLA